MTTKGLILIEPMTTEPRLRPLPDQTQTSTPRLAGRRVPLTMSREQEYFWHTEWQCGERAALADLEAGRRVRFDSDDPSDVARWLDAPDDDDAG